MTGQPQPTPQTATVRLRGRAGPLPVAVFWPAHPHPRPRRPRRLVVALDAGPERAQALCARTGRVVLAVDGPALDDLYEVVGWAGAHAAELGAVPDDVLVTAADAALLARVQARAHAEDWPRLAVLD
jgi:hypothetical protein